MIEINQARKLLKKISSFKSFIALRDPCRCLFLKEAKERLLCALDTIKNRGIN